MTNPATVVKVTKEGIDAADKALDLYNKVLDQVIPWSTFEDTLKEMVSFEKDYSDEAGKLIGSVQTLLQNSQDEYHSATQSVFEWCSLTIRLLTAYKTLFDNYDDKKAEAQRQVLLKVLSEGYDKLAASQAKLEESSKSFNDATGKLTELNNRLKSDFDSKSVWFESQVAKIRKEAYAGAAAGAVAGPLGLAIAYSIAAGVVEGKLVPELEAQLKNVKQAFEQLKTLVAKAQTDIKNAKDRLQDEVKVLGNVKVDVQDLQFNLEYLSDMQSLVEPSVDALMASCNQYRKRHGGKSLLS
jgi:hemolysin E